MGKGLGSKAYRDAAPAVVKARLAQSPTILLDAAAGTAVSADAVRGVHFWQRGSHGIRCGAASFPRAQETRCTVLRTPNEAGC